MASIDVLLESFHQGKPKRSTPRMNLKSDVAFKKRECDLQERVKHQHRLKMSVAAEDEAC